MDTLTYDIALVRLDDGTLDVNRPTWFMVQTIVADLGAAQAIIALFPKFVGLKVVSASGSTKGTGFITMQIGMLPGPVNKGANETGLKRIKGFFAACAKHGISVEKTHLWGNSSAKTAADYGWV